MIPWNKPGYTSAAKLEVAAGAITVPGDLQRVKLLRDHSNTPGFTPVGYATAAQVTEEGLEMTFKIGATEDGDRALADVTEGIRDALSVELIDTQVSGGKLTAGTLTAVALVPIPAFADARVAEVHAAMTPKEDKMNDQNNPEPDELETEPDTTNDADTAAELETEPDTEEEEDTMKDNQTNETVTAARVPSSIVTGPGRAELSFSQAVETIAAARMGNAGSDLTAALADITRSANPSISGPAWLGEMWDGVEYTREIVPTMTQKTLTAMRGIGWRWVQRPEVEDYEGDKAEIPTNEVSTEPVEVKAKRLAVGHDIDRAYFDFNETEFLQSFFAARANDYAIKTDERAAQFLVESAKTGTKLTDEPDLLHAAARGRMTIKRQTRTEPRAFLVNPADMFGLFSITQLDNPAYLDLLGVDPSKFRVTDLVPEGQMIVYAKPAVTFFELPGAPIRVDAERLTHGGIDSAVFGYYATLLNNQQGIVKVPFSKAPAVTE